MIEGSGRALVAWAALVVPLGVVMVLCTHWEPVMADGWGSFYWYRSPIGLHDLYDLWWSNYVYDNPRLGQLLTVLLYTPGPYHVVVAPLVELSVFAALTVLALGRWPRLRSDDALVAVIIAGVIAACLPQIGPMLFYRPYTGNYTFGLAINLAWLVPYRLEITAARPRRRWFAPILFVVGVAAGLCNEHTGIAFGAMARRGLRGLCGLRGLRGWMIAGLVGLVAGYALLLTAPGQHARYSGLADHAGVVGRIVERGLVGNLGVFGALALALAPALPLVVLGLVERRVRAASNPSPDRAAWIALALGGVLCLVTVLASPKIGPRLYFASVALIAAALGGWLGHELHRRWARRGAAVLAACTLAFVELRLVGIYRVVGPIGALRIARLEHGAPGSVVTLPTYPPAPARYFLGEDLVAARRQTVTALYQLQAIELEATPK